MKVLLANPATRVSLNEKYERFFIKAGSRWPWSTIKRKSEKNSNIFFPFFLAYSANILKQMGQDVYVIDGVAMDMQKDEFLHRTGKIAPEAVVIETTTHAINHDVRLVQKIKNILPSVKIILAGPHVTVFAKEILQDNDFIDFITMGEYEFTLAELIERLASKSNRYKIDGLAYRNKNEIWVSERKGFIEDIDMLPYPAFELFPCNEEPNLSIYRDGICAYRPAVTLHSSRGCPFRCDFCLWTQVMYGNHKYRMFSPKRVVDEMEYVIKNYGAREIYFDDDDFCIDKRHVLDICRQIRDRKLRIKWSCMGDATCIDEEMIMAMSEAGCIFMKFGVESGNERILKNIGKPLRPKRAIEISKICRKYGIWTHATFSFGLDGEMMETMKDTLRLANKIKFDYAQASITTPFPGTRYYEKLVERGQLKQVEWDKFDGTSSCVFDTEYLSSSEIEMFRKKAIRSMILHKLIDPWWIIRNMKRNFILLKNYGLRTVLVPFKALYYTFIIKRFDSKLKKQNV